MTEWARKYGPLVHVKVGLQHHIIINDAQIGKDLLDKKSYSSRPPTKVGDIISGGRRAVLIQYDNHWRHIRRIYTGVLKPQSCDRYLHIQEGVHRDPTKPTTELGQLPPRVTSIPATRCKGVWDFRKAEEKLALSCYNTALEDAEKYPDRKSLARDIHREMKLNGGEVDPLQAAAICMEVLAAGSDTTATSLTSFVHACVAYPGTVKKAQEELDRVIGRNRFQDWDDQHKLPYVRAMIKEQHRWRTLAPLGFFRWTDEEDVCNGYRIPKDSMIRINNWTIHMDERRYEDPQHFRPERFLNHHLGAAEYAASPNVAERDHFSYGGGRRIYPGMHLAERSLFNMSARLLHTFNIKHALDENGNEIPIDPNAYRTTLILGPEPFKARFEQLDVNIKWVKTAGESTVISDSPEGNALREKIKSQVTAHDGENKDHGIKIGYRYKDSPIIVSDSNEPEPEWNARQYIPSTWPGARAPSVFLADGETNIYDLFGREYTITDFADDGNISEEFMIRAAALGIPLTRRHLPSEQHAHSVWERSVVLIRPNDRGLAFFN
ncbi:hypothetical protein N7493_010435 [Penicillium malachiteum]|uniref:Cytochrome P450 n=1 Tax=Penicillium malachiteum TaxID=1324776 RepID=A0AAD6MRN3_9EURO|nr:hypothetical protein N7493_010435 [Penicillium malachiteum]